MEIPSPQHRPLSVNVSDTLTLNAGWWEETIEKMTSGEDLPCRLIHPPEPTMYQQIIHYLETVSHEAKIPPKSQLDFGEVALATIAVCIRYGTYFAVLADQTKPLWPMTEQAEISMIGDGEMKRINIEASAALAEWIELMRADDGHFRKLVKAAQTLPMVPSSLDPKTNYNLFRAISYFNSAQVRQTFLAILKEGHGDKWVEERSVGIMVNPARWIANGMINAYWRNESGIEDIHAGEWVASPLLQRRITPLQEYTLIKDTAEGIVPGMHAIYNIINKKSADGWEKRSVLLGLGLYPPDYWSMTDQTVEVLLEGAEW